MPYIEPEALQEARRIDLLTWLRMNDPDNLVHVSGNTFCTAEHDSLKISNGKWYWFSRGIGGVSALDYLIKVKEIPLPQAVEMIAGAGAVSYKISYQRAEPKQPKKLLIPELERYPVRAKNYLRSRGISQKVIDYGFSHSLIFETKDYHNVMFVGYDREGRARYAAMRGTGSAYKGEVTGSDKRYSFSICPNEHPTKLHLFEAAIDLLSFATLEEMDGRDWKQDALLSLAGVFAAKRNDVVPVALQTFLDGHPEIKTIHLHLDNDEVGRKAAEGIRKGLGDRYQVLDEPPESGKDVNEHLMNRIRNTRRKEVPER